MSSHRMFLGLSVFLLLVSVYSSSFAQTDQIPVTRNKDDDYVLILMNNEDIITANKARDLVVHEGGRIIIFAPPHVMIGWVPFEVRKAMIGKYGIERFIQEPIDLKDLKYTDEQARNAVLYFNNSIGVRGRKGDAQASGKAGS